jgi:LAS superfamily LD-carboxypeptidase LdcB
MKLMFNRRPYALFLLLLYLMTVGAAEAALPEATPAPVELPQILALGGDLFLINRERKISKDYEPEDLVTPDVQTRKDSLQERIFMRKAAAKALEQMFRAALFEGGYTLYAASGYRSYGIQQILFTSKVEEAGSREKAQRRVAPPGTSEHQLGLAMDVQSPGEKNLNAAFGDTDEGKWVAENAHRFGFILRYKEEWRSTTGYSAEPWHIRYVGIAHATALSQLDIPLETYAAYAAQLPGFVLSGGSHPLLIGLVKALMEGQEPEGLESLRVAQVGQVDEALRLATLPFLTGELSYEQALWYAYPTPRPTAAPWIDKDEETRLSPETGG